ncbi:hypothetical protein E2C01_072145 [Portunus trituberculatus]|uniref:Uncharacterized protein n=1 Tax=Portunus trituberculatus TaxID=210409 RepID=A0A5B7I6E0_PORTR|nr:hypothetical protein [Portunus trituberculatus]
MLQEQVETQHGNIYLSERNLKHTSQSIYNVAAQHSSNIATTRPHHATPRHDTTRHDTTHRPTPNKGPRTAARRTPEKK